MGLQPFIVPIDYNSILKIWRMEREWMTIVIILLILLACGISGDNRQLRTDGPMNRGTLAYVGPSVILISKWP